MKRPDKLQELSNRVTALEKQRNGDSWLDSQDVFELLHISKRTLQTWRDRGMIAYHKWGKKVWYKRKDIDETIERMRVHNDHTPITRKYLATADYKN